MCRTVIICLMLACVTLSASARQTAKLENLAKRNFTCAKGEVRLIGDAGSNAYPAGKREKVTVKTKIGMLRYTCRSIRSVVSCPVGTTEVSVRRTSYRGTFDVQCLGDPSAILSGTGTRKDKKWKPKRGDGRDRPGLGDLEYFDSLEDPVEDEYRGEFEDADESEPSVTELEAGDSGDPLE